ncbi:MAG: DNA methyltransferase, partial [Candidatus Binatia bacterium]
MFPEEFVAKQVLAYTERGDVVFDPFCGRGTAVFESLLNGRRGAGVDINPVAVCVAGAKADTPLLSSVLARLSKLRTARKQAEVLPIPAGSFFNACFHPTTLQQILFLRREIDWRGSRVDRFVAAVVLGCLHG